MAKGYRGMGGVARGGGKTGYSAPGRACGGEGKRVAGAARRGTGERRVADAARSGSVAKPRRSR